MSNCSKPTRTLKEEISNSFLEYFSGSNRNNWFIGLGNPIPWSFDKNIINQNRIFLSNYDSGFEFQDQFIPPNSDTDRNKFDFYRTCTAIKKVSKDDISFLIEKNPWTINTIYYPYRDDQEMFLPGKKFYVYNQDNRCVYKCIENSAFGPSAAGETAGISLYPPNSTTTEIIDTMDGYKWKLIYQLTPADELKFSVNGRTDLDSFIPVKYIDYNPTINEQEAYLQKTVQDSAVNGSISSVYVNPIYQNLFKYDEDFCVVGGNFPIYAREDESEGATSILVDYYGNNSSPNTLRNMFLHVISGPGSGQVRKIKSSTRTVAGGGSYLNLIIDELDVGISAYVDENTEASKINILPGIEIFGDGESNSPVDIDYSLLEDALAIPKFDDNKILRAFDMVDIGKNYTFANAYLNSRGLTAVSSTLNPVIPEDLIKVSMSPLGGHGSNALKELGASKILIKNSFVGNESSVLNPSNEFRQIGLLKNPELSRSKVKIRTVDGVGGTIDEGDSITLTGPGVTAYGIVDDKYSFADSRGHEFIVSGLSGDRGNYQFINTIQIDPYDGVEFIDVAGQENKITKTLKATQNITNISPRDVLLGIGNKETGVLPSYATGKVLEKSTTDPKNLEVESINGTFKQGELIYAFTRGGTSSGSFTLSEITDDFTTVLESTYNMTTKLTIESEQDQFFDKASFTKDQIVYAFSEKPDKFAVTNEFKANAYCFYWRGDIGPTIGQGGSSTNTGTLEIVGSKPGQFSIGDYILYFKNNLPYYAVINNVIEPQILYGTGDIVFIQNFAGIERYAGSQEDINLIIGL